MSIQAVVFDIGNVLVEWSPEDFYDSQIGPDRRRTFFDAVPILAMNADMDRGAPFAQSVAALARAHPDWHDEVMLWQTGWPNMFAPQIDLSVHLMQALQAKGVPVFSLTNFGVEVYEIGADMYPIMRAFDRDFISGHMRVIKPDPRIYEMVEEASGLSGDALIFTDDSAANIAAADARGWRTHLFEGPQGWADRLVAEGLLTGEEARQG
ncbi:MAG: HAD-IA family hydrolase [Pseudomonadota bacterium]